jgi:transcriptional regulator with XRE-family HTH domain
VKKADNFFSSRLTQALINRGLRSHIAAIGVQATPLAKYLGVSVQTIRKYLANQAIPNLTTISNMAKFLDVSPGWLAFGEESTLSNTEQIFEIKKIFIQEIFTGVFKDILHIQLTDSLSESICDFLYGIINDIVQLETSDEIKLRLIKTAVSSASIMEKTQWKKTATST